MLDAFNAMLAVCSAARRSCCARPSACPCTCPRRKVHSSRASQLRKKLFEQRELHNAGHPARGDVSRTCLTSRVSPTRYPGYVEGPLAPFVASAWRFLESVGTVRMPGVQDSAVAPRPATRGTFRVC